MYQEPYSKQSCGNCRYKIYDSFHNERWCTHKPPPDGLGEQLLIDNSGSCEFFEVVIYD